MISYTAKSNAINSIMLPSCYEGATRLSAAEGVPLQCLETKAFAAAYQSFTCGVVNSKFFFSIASNNGVHDSLP